jgi:hypothetical protein
MENLSGVLSKILSYNRDQMPQFDNEFLNKAEIIKGNPADSYFSDKTRMNSTSLKNILRSPRYFLSQWKEISDDKEADHFRIGRAAHLMLLEPDIFRRLHVVEPEFIGVTKDGKPTKNPNALDVKKQKEEWLAKQSPDAIILKQEELDQLVGMIESVLDHPVANAMLKNGVAEATIKWTDRDTGIMCKGRPDFITFEPNGDYHLIDFKTSRNIQRGSFTKDIISMQYHLSMAFYADGLMEVYGRLPSSISLFPVEKTSPHEAAVFIFEDEWYEIGKQMYKAGLNLYKKCIDEGKWPRFQHNAQTIAMPQWAQDYIEPEYNFN